MAVDKVKWHYMVNGWPAGLGRRNAATHMGLFFEWAIRRGLASDELRESYPRVLWLLKRRWITGRFFILRFCDQTLDSLQDLNDTGHAFAEAHYDKYLAAYAEMMRREYPTEYHAPNSRRNAGRVYDLLDGFYSSWLKTS